MPALLRTAHNLLSIGVFQGVSEAGFGDLRPAHGNAMESLALEGELRLTTLAERAGMAPQSMGELVDDLATLGYVERGPDPGDRRAKLIRLTERGRASATASRQATSAVEARLADLLGERRYRSLRRILVTMVDHSEWFSRVPASLGPSSEGRPPGPEAAASKRPAARKKGRQRDR